MTPEETQKAIMLVALLHTSQTLLDDLPVSNEFKHKLKFRAVNFSEELEKFLKAFYKNMDEEANLEYNKHLKTFEMIIQEALKGNVEIE